MTKHVFICFGDRRRIVALPSAYNSLLKAARKQFPNMGSLYSLVALYQPEDFKDTIDRNCWVELDQTAYSTLHDRAVLHFNVQHHLTKEYMLPLPNSNPNTQPRSQVAHSQKSPLINSPRFSSVLDDGCSSIEQSTSTVENVGDDGDACESSWGGASERFRRSAKYIPTKNDCEEAARRSYGQSVDPESNSIKNTAEQMLPEPKEWWQAAIDYRDQPQYQHFEVCTSDDEQKYRRKLCHAQNAVDVSSSTPKTVLPCEIGDENKRTTESQTKGWHRAPWKSENTSCEFRGLNSHIGGPQTTFKQTIAPVYTGWGSSSFKNSGDEKLSEVFAQSIPARGSVAGAVPGGWGASCNAATGSPVQYQQEHDFVNSPHRLTDTNTRRFNRFDRPMPTASPETIRLAWSSPVQPPPLDVPFPEGYPWVPAPEMSWNHSNTAHLPASTWSPERQTQKQSRLDKLGQVEGIQNFYHGPYLNEGSPFRRGRTMHRSSRYWGCRDPQGTNIKTTHHLVPTVDVVFKQHEASYDSDATIYNHDRSSADGNAAIPINEYRRADKFIHRGRSKAFDAGSSNSDTEADDSADLLWGKASKGWHKTDAGKRQQKWIYASTGESGGAQAKKDKSKGNSKTDSWLHDLLN